MNSTNNNTKSLNNTSRKTTPQGCLGTVTYKTVPLSEHEWQEKCKQIRREDAKFFDRIDADFKRMFAEARAKRAASKK